METSVTELGYQLDLIWLYASVIVFSLFAIAALFAVAWLAFCWLDDNFRVMVNPTKLIALKVKCGKWSLLVMRKYMILVHGEGPARILFDSEEVRAWWDAKIQAARDWALRLTPWPVYFWHVERDCDHFWVECGRRYPNGWTAWKHMIECYEDAEGPCTFSRLSRSEYLDAIRKGPRYRDEAAEMMGY